MEASLPAGELELAGHDEHVQLLLLDRYSPMPHASQPQSDAASLPAGELLFAGQAVHTQLLLLDQYSPALQELHGEQSSPLAPVKPVLQIQSERALLRASEVLFAGQSEHTPDDDCPVDGEYLPAPQSVQLPGPCSSL